MSSFIMPNPYTYILNICNLKYFVDNILNESSLIGFASVLWQIKHLRLSNSKSYLYIYIKYIISEHIL